jgi:hypothetical protein
MGKLGSEASAAFERHVAGCPVCQKWLDEAWIFIPAMQLALLEALADTGPRPIGDRRKERRFAFRKEVALVAACRSSEAFAGELHDLSQTGAGLLTDHEFPPRTPLAISCTETELLGTVRYYSLTEAGRFQIGVALEPDSHPWPGSFLAGALSIVDIR